MREISEKRGRERRRVLPRVESTAPKTISRCDSAPASSLLNSRRWRDVSSAVVHLLLRYWVDALSLRYSLVRSPRFFFQIPRSLSSRSRCAQSGTTQKDGGLEDDMADCTPDYPVLGMQDGEEVGVCACACVRVYRTRMRARTISLRLGLLKQLHLLGVQYNPRPTALVDML